MLASRLGFVASSLARVNRPTYLLLQRGIKETTASTQTSIKLQLDEDDAPIPYSTSPAAEWKAQYHRDPPEYHVSWTKYSLALSVAIFMLYFCILREENDIDELIYKPLPETIEGIDKVFPDFDFYKKPDYVRYYEEQRAKKMQEKLDKLNK